MEASDQVAPHRHRALVTVLFVVAVLTAFVGAFAVWVNRQALNTEHWTDTSSQLLADKQIQAAVSAYAVDELFSNVDVAAQLQELLPPKADVLAGPASAGLRQLADRLAPRVIASTPAQQAWRGANTAAHKQLLRILNGGGPIVSTANGDVVLNLHELVDQLAAQLGVESQVAAAREKLAGSAGQTARAAAQQRLGVTLPNQIGQLTIMHSDQLATTQRIAKVIRHLAVWLTAISLLLFALAVFLAEGWRRIALRTTGFFFVGLGLSVLLARIAVGNRVVDSVATTDSVRAAAHNAWAIATTLLHDIGIALFAYGVIIVVAAWLAGPTRVSVEIRRALAPTFRHRIALVWGVVGVAFLLILLWGPTAATRQPIGIVGFAAVLALGIEALRRQVVREHPDAQRGDTSSRLRGWVERMRQRTRVRAGTHASPSSSPTDDRLAALERLGGLHERGLLTDAEFRSEKTHLLGGATGDATTS